MVEYGLIGRGIGHSFSAGYFNDKFLREGIEARYIPFDIDSVGEIEEILEKHPYLSGFNVTSPYKREIIPYLDSLSENAAELNAVNTVKVERDIRGRRQLSGHNTDWRGFGMTIEGLVQPGSRALVLGTGGASSAVCLALRKNNIDYKVVSRNPQEGQLGYEEIGPYLRDCTLIINATPVGMHPNVNEVPPIDFSMIRPGHICYDLIYNPERTLFLEKAAEKGAEVINGHSMLINQAELSWRIWNK